MPPRATQPRGKRSDSRLAARDLWRNPSSGRIVPPGRAVQALVRAAKLPTSADTTRAAAMIAAFAVGVWAYCAVPVLVRASDAVNDRRTPVMIGTLAVVLNFTLICADLATRRSRPGRIHGHRGDNAGRSIGDRLLALALPTRLAATLGHGVADRRSDRRDVVRGPDCAGIRPQNQSHRQRNRARCPAARYGNRRLFRRLLARPRPRTPDAPWPATRAVYARVALAISPTNLPLPLAFCNAETGGRREADCSASRPGPSKSASCGGIAAVWGVEWMGHSPASVPVA